ncbi:MAG: alpha/beta hydrolase [Bacilli bacterium]
MNKKLIIISLLSLSLICSCGTKKETSTSSSSSSNDVSSISSTSSSEAPLLYKEEVDLAYGGHERNKLNIYIPKNKASNGLVLFIHGGAWISGDKKDYIDSCKFYSSYGYLSATMNYRYASEDVTCENILEDITSAIKFIKNYVSFYDIDLDGLMLGGHSAGGHLSLLYGYKCKDISPVPVKGIISLAGPTDLTHESYYTSETKDLAYGIFSYLIGDKLNEENKESKRELLESISPLYYVSSDCAPTLIVQGDEDLIVNCENSYLLADKLKANNVPYELIIFPHSGHMLSGDEEKLNETYSKIGSFIVAAL